MGEVAGLGLVHLYVRGEEGEGAVEGWEPVVPDQGTRGLDVRGVEVSVC